MAGALYFTGLCSPPSVPTCSATPHLIWGNNRRPSAAPFIVFQLTVFRYARRLRGHR
jgi:hypothetical protein